MKAKRVIEFAARYGGLDYAAERAHSFSIAAKEQLAPFPDTPSKASLIAFADFVVARNK
jgi:geranylgeranyl pyrophosphate synthase